MATPWSVPRMWSGRTVAILATGPSMSQQIADEVCTAALPTIAINDAHTLAPWADMLYAADSGWWRHHAQTALKFPGLKVTCHDSCEFKAVMLLRQSTDRGGVDGFDPNPKHIRTGGNSGYQAIHVAIHTGASRILLFGYDMKGSHWFGKHPAPLRNTDPNSFVVWIDRFKGLIGHGAEIINCTPGSAIECFPKMTLKEALQ